MKKFSKDFIKSSRNAIKVMRANFLVIPEEGMGATTGAGSDCYPNTIVEVAPDLSYIIIQDDNYKVDFVSNTGIHYKYSPDPNGARRKYTLRKNGQYIAEGAPMKAYYCRVSIGFRRYYQDPSF